MVEHVSAPVESSEEMVSSNRSLPNTESHPEETHRTLPEEITESKPTHSNFTLEVCEVSSHPSEVGLSEIEPAEHNLPDENIARTHSAKESFIHVSYPTETTTTAEKTTWQPKWNRTGPILGLTALILSALSIPVAFAILKASDGKAVDSWKYSPSVYLAVITSITGKALSLAALQGAVIAWWLSAIRGSSVERLHWNWQMGQNIWEALTAGRRINMIAIACICAAIAAVDSPLLQRASSVIPAVPNTPVTLAINLVPELPAYYSGTAEYALSNITRWNTITDIHEDFQPLVNQWIRQESIAGVVAGCPGTCSTTVRAPMLMTWNCTWEDRFVNYTKPLPGNKTFEEQGQFRQVMIDRTTFQTSVLLDPSGFPNIEREFMRLLTRMTDDQVAKTCAGNLKTRDCLLAPAIGEYDLIVRNNETQYAGGFPAPRFVAWNNNTSLTPETNKRFNISMGDLPQTEDYEYSYNSTFGGLANAMSYKYKKQAYALPYVGGVGNIDVTDWILKYVSLSTSFDDCMMSWVDPYNDILSDLNDLMFRTAVHVSRPDFRQDLTSEAYYHLDAGIADSINYTNSGAFISMINIYNVDYLFFWGAAIIELVCIGVIMYTFYGWWMLGRAVSFSPLELAKAFRSPMFSGVNSNTESDKISEEYKGRRVRYGIVGMEADELAFEDADQVQKPVDGAMFSR